MDNKDYLQHYGILGMKWGRRKGSTSITKPRNHSEDHIKKVTLKKKKLHEMSNAELKALNERMQLEKQYKDLNKQDVSAGKKFVLKVLSDIGTEATKSLVKSAFTGEIGKNQYTNGIKSMKEAINIGQGILKKKPKWNEA